VVYLDPKVACGVLVERDGRVLLVRRRHEPGRGLWCLPCGFEDADEPPERTARREAREEAGLDVVLDGLLGIYHYTDDPRGAGILLVFRARCEAAAAPAPGDDADAVGFFAPDALPPISHHTHRRALDEWVAENMTKQPTNKQQEQLRARLRQLVLMRETGPKSAAWHAARVRLIWRLHNELKRADEEQGKEERISENDEL
jgi:ADP-ribose pyrophosphatase YjhB (NUDIX family)